jgi:hypothetical protein
LQEQAAVIFRNLSVNSENKVLIVQGDAVPGLLALLRSPQDPTAVEGDPEYEAQVASYKQSLKVQEQAAGAMRNLSMHAENKGTLVSLGIIPPTLLLLQSDETAIKEQGAGILRNMSVSAPHGAIIISDGAVPHLVSLLRVPDLKVQEQAAATLRNLSATPENRPALVQAGTLPLLIELLSSPEEKIQEQAGVALRNLSDQVDH